MLNERFGMLRVVAEAGTNKHQKRLWSCTCDCGGETVVVGGSLKSGLTKSCGCARRAPGRNQTHGQSRTPAYNIWCKLRDRCDNPQNKEYRYWGGRGITYDPRWNSFENFYADMGDPPKGTSIDRVNNDDNYSAGNCRWATPLTQSRNNRQAHPVTSNGRTMLLVDWAKELGIKPAALSQRMSRGMTPEQAVAQGRMTAGRKSRTTT
jgi:hypothetical protein